MEGKERVHMMITHINGNTNVTVAGWAGLNTWRSYFKITPSSKKRLNELLKGKQYRVSAYLGESGPLLSIIRD
jgi:hypothetical protein